MQIVYTIQEILNGDINAENELYCEYRPIIKSFIQKNYAKRIDDIDDDISEILIKVFLNLHKYDCKISKFKSWVLTITRNYMIDKFRCPSMKFSTPISTISNIKHHIENYSNDNSYNFESEQLNGDLNTEVDIYQHLFEIRKQLSVDDFSLLEMKYIQGYNYNEIGNKFNLSSTTISNKVNYIKSKIKKNYIFNYENR